MSELKERLERLADLGTPRGAPALWNRVSEQLAVQAKSGTEPTKRGRACRSSIVIAVSVSLVLGLLVAGVAVLTRTTSRRHPSVVAGGGASSTQQALTSEPTHALLASIDSQQGMEIADVDAGTAKTVVAGPVNLGPCNTCPVVGRGDLMFFTRDGRAYMVDRVDGSVNDLGPANVVFGASDNRSVWVASTSRDSATVTKLDEHGDRIGGPWAVPAGYHIAFQFLPKEIGGRILVLLGPVDSRSLYAWDPTGGGFIRIGDALFVVDTYRHPDASAETLAWVPEASCRSGLRRCSLALTDIASNQTRTVDAPSDSNGFIGGGGFSPDGRTLATFVEAAPAKQGPAARLVLVDTASGAVHEVRGGQIGIGESYGYATWDPTGKWLFFGGFPGNVLVHRAGTDDAVALGLPGRYTSVALTAPAAPAPEPATTGPPAAAPELLRPTGLAVGPDGSVYVADEFAHRVLKIPPRGSAVVVAGTGSEGSSGDGGLATSAQLRAPHRLAVAPDGTLYIADMADNRIRAVAPDGSIRTFAGTGARGYTGDGGSADGGQINQPSDLVLDPGGALLFTEFGNDVVREVSTDGIMNTVAGVGPGQLPTQPLSAPQALARDFNGNLYVASFISKKTYKTTPGGAINSITTPQGELGYVTDLTTDAQGNVIAADYGTFHIDLLSPDGTVLVIARPDKGQGVQVRGLLRPSGVASDPNGSVLLTNDGGNDGTPAVFRVSQDGKVARLLPPG